MPPIRQLAAIMFSDIAGYTALMGKDEDKAFSLLDANRRIQKPLIKEFNGKWLKELGDGVLAQFNSAYDAVKCAIEIQKAAGQHLGGKLRIGIHLGDITMEDNDVFGDGVNVASRMQGIADPGGVYITESIEKAIRNRSDIQTKYLGETELKNVDYQVKVYAVQGEGLPVPVFRKAKKQKIRPGTFALISLLAVLLISGWIIITKYYGDNLSAGQIRSMVVLPFSNLNGSEEQDYIAAGTHGELINELSQVNSLRVISRQTAMSYANSRKSLPQIARELNVDAVVESSVLLVKDSIKLNVQVFKVDPEEDRIYAGAFGGGMKDVLILIGHVAQNITKNIRLALSPEEKKQIAVKKTIDPELYKLYLKGKYYLDQYTPEGFQKGIQHLNEAIQKDPTFALPYAALSIGYGDLAHLPSAPQEAFPRAKALAERALKLDPSLVEANTAIAESNLYHDFHFKSAENFFRRALAIDSNFAPCVSNYGWYLDLVGDKERAEKFLRKAADLDPLAPIYRTWLAWWYWNEKRYDDGIAELQRVLKFSPEFPIAKMVLGGIYSETGKYDEAIALSKQATEAFPGLEYGLGLAYIKAGRKEEAKKLLDQMEKTPFNAFSLVLINAEMGNLEETIKWIRVVYEIRHIFTPWLTTGFFAENIRNDPRVQEILKPIIDSIAAARS